MAPVSAVHGQSYLRGKTETNAIPYASRRGHQLQKCRRVGHLIDFGGHDRVKHSEPSWRSAEPNAVTGGFGDVAAIEQAEQIAQPRESDQALVTQGGTRDVAGDEDR